MLGKKSIHFDLFLKMFNYTFYYNSIALTLIIYIANSTQ